jgi:hypothetical protein
VLCWVDPAGPRNEAAPVSGSPSDTSNGVKGKRGFEAKCSVESTRPVRIARRHLFEVALKHQQQLREKGF